MIIIDDKIIADDILSEQFYCNLKACKGQCCVEGLCGAPLDDHEKEEIERAFPHIQHLLSFEALEEIERQGHYLTVKEHGLVTPTVGNGICVYGIVNNKTVYCAFEQAYNDKKTQWKKPISCHLFPIRIQQTALNELLNYEQLDICKSACSLGEEKKIKVFRFLKEALIRKYGADFYEALEQIDARYMHLAQDEKRRGE